MDESPAQTRAILEAQRHRHTLDGLRHRRQREAILRRHHAFQRLLKPLTVVNPFEPFLTYAEDRLAVRRDNPKYLHLILAVTFLHQLQRPLRNDAELGDYIETTLDDVAVANDIAHELFGHSLDDLSRPGRQLLDMIFDYAAKKTDGAGEAAKAGGAATFTRRELREAFKWGDTRLRTHLDELVQMEYLVPLSGRFGQTFQYRLAYDPEQAGDGGRFLAGLKSVEQVRQEANLAGVLPHLASQNGHLAPTSQVEKREVQNAPNPHEQRAKTVSARHLAPVLGTPVLGGERRKPCAKP
ncbi:MAG: hypothetical protein ACRD5L_10055 [Bryobacteraceae bacterium]